MIHITKSGTGILLERGDTAIAIDDHAIRSALGPIIDALITSGHALAQARRESYEAGLLQGYQQCAIEYTTSERIADRQAADLVDALEINGLVCAA